MIVMVPIDHPAGAVVAFFDTVVERFIEDDDQQTFDLEELQHYRTSILAYLIKRHPGPYSAALKYLEERKGDK